MALSRKRYGTMRGGGMIPSSNLRQLPVELFRKGGSLGKKRLTMQNGGLVEPISPRQFSIGDIQTRPENLTGIETTGLQSITPTTGGINLPDIDFNLEENIGDVANVSNLISNLSSVRRQETEFSPSFVEAPRFTFQRRSGLDRARLAQAGRAGRRGIVGSSTQGRGAQAAAITAAQFGAESEVGRREAEREDAARARFEQQLSQTDAINTQILNQAQFGNLARRNLRRAQGAQARQAFLQGVIGNQERRDQQRLNRARALAIAARSGETGVSERLLNQFPELRTALNLD